MLIIAWFTSTRRVPPCIKHRRPQRWRRPYKVLWPQKGRRPKKWRRCQKWRGPPQKRPYQKLGGNQPPIFHLPLPNPAMKNLYNTWKKFFSSWQPCHNWLKPEIEFKMMNKMYVALCMRTHIQKRQHFYHRRLMQNFTRNDLHIVEAHTALDIFSFAVFFFIWGSPLKLSLSLIFLQDFIIKHARQTIHLTVLSYCQAHLQLQLQLQLSWKMR